MDRKTNLRNMEITGSEAKDVRDTKMLSTTAREHNATGKNEQKEYVTGKGPKGELGFNGRK
jgi:hypothetical protein